MGNDPGRAAAASYAFSGTITAISLGTNTLTVKGTSYVFIARSAKLQNPKPGVTNATLLRAGMQMGFNVTRDGAKSRVTEFWLLD